MQKYFLILFLFLLAMFNIAQADTYTDLSSQKKPCAILIYADWADNLNDVQSVFNQMRNKYSDKYNFMSMNIGSEAAKEFNKTNIIAQNLPYVLLLKERARISRTIVRSCAMDRSCIKDKFDAFTD